MSPRLRVCHLGKYYPPAAGGIETHVQTLARAQADLGAHVRVVCVDHLDGGGERQAGRRMGTLNLWSESDGPVRVTRVVRRASFNRLDICPDLPETLRMLEHEKLDILHLHTPNPTMLLALALVRPRIPLVITHHSDVIRQKLLKLALRPFERFVYGRAARIQTTPPVYRHQSRFLARYDGRIEVLPLGVDCLPFSEPKTSVRQRARQLELRHGKPLWLAVGRLVYYKALHIALHALREIPGTLVVIGTGPLQEDLRDLARRLGVAHRVCWQGYLSREELAAHYRAATALWFPSNTRSEAFGLVQVEAMASGCPVINARISGSGVPWVSLHEETGLTIPVDDPAALAQAARRLLDEPGLRDRLAWAAYRRARREFDHRTMALRSLAIYRRALRGEPAPTDAIPDAWGAQAYGPTVQDLVDKLSSPAMPAMNLDTDRPNTQEAQALLHGADFPDASLAPLLREPLRRD